MRAVVGDIDFVAKVVRILEERKAGRFRWSAVVMPTALQEELELEEPEKVVGVTET